MQYHKGKMINCPHCRKDAIVQLKTEMDGWQKIGECLACNICGEKLAPVDNSPKESSNKSSNSERGVFADFLGTENSIERNDDILGDVGDVKFCKDCRNYVENPFNTRCMLHEKEGFREFFYCFAYLVVIDYSF